VSSRSLVGPVRLGRGGSLDAASARIYWITSEGHLELIDLRSGQSITNPPGAIGLRANNVWPSPNGAWFVVSNRLGMNVIEARDSATGRLLIPPLTFPLEEEPAFSPSGDLLALPGDREAVVIDRRKPEEVPRRLPLDTLGKAVKFLSDRTLAIATIDGRVAVWDVETGQLRERGIRHPGGYVLLATLPDGRLATAGWDGTVRATRIAAGGPAWSHAWPDSDSSQAVIGLDAHPTEDAVAVATSAGHGAVCRIGESTCVWDRDFGHKLRNVAFVDRGRMVLFGQDGGGFSLHDAASGAGMAAGDVGLAVGDRARPIIAYARDGGPLELRRAVPGLPILCASGQALTDPSALAMSDDGAYVLAVTAGTAKAHRLIAFNACSCAKTWARDIDADIDVLAASGRLGVVAAGGETGTALYGLADGAPRGRPLEDRNTARSLAFHLEQPLLLVANSSGWIAGYDIEREQQRFTPFKADAYPWATAFSQSGETFIVAFITPEREGRFTAWRYDTELGQPVAPPMPHPKSVMSVAATASGAWIVTGATDGVVRAWSAGSEQRAAADVLAAIARATGETIDEASGAIHSAVSADPAVAASFR
jgi:WD40 repeat protein